jgi:hypothetical protein
MASVYDDFCALAIDCAAARRVRSACAGALGPRASQRRKLRREEVLRAMSPVFAMSDEYAMYEEVGLNRAQGDADALGEPIDPTRSDNGIVIWSSEEVWGVEVARVVQFSIVQARRFREWAPQ